jgi:membrane protein
MQEREPDSPAQLTRPSWIFVLRKSAREFSRDQCTDLAAGLTYYGVLAMFPALIALFSLVGLVGKEQQTVDTLKGILNDLGGGPMATVLSDTIDSLAAAPQAAGIAFVVGLATAIWSASAYVGSFGRSLNRIYAVREGRPFWKLRPIQLLVTLVVLVLATAVALALVLSGPVAKAIGDALGVGSTALTVWNLAKWPLMLLAVVVIVALLYWATPNVKQPTFRWLSVGAVVSIAVWVVASALFGFYVSRFSSYNKTYGSLAGVVIFLLWLWITNLALLFGAELDAELERGRELQAGIAAERTVQLELRDTRSIDKADRQREEEVERGRRLREMHQAGSRQG